MKKGLEDKIDKVSLSSRVQSFEEVNRELIKVNDTLNALLEKTTQTSEVDTTEGTEGNPGDNKTILNSDKTYSFSIRTEDGWKTPFLESREIIFKSKNPNAGEIKKSIDEIESKSIDEAKKTIFDEKNDKFVLPRPDYDSGWQAIDNSTHHRTTSGLILTHNIGAMPKLVQLFCSEDNAEDEYHGTLHGLVENHSHGITYLVNSSTITIWTGDTGIFRLVHGSGTNTDVTSGYIRAMIWK